MKKIIGCLCILASGTLFADPVAKILFATPNDVLSRHNEVEKPSPRGTTLEMGDSVITKPGAKAVLAYINGTVVTLGPDTEYKIIAYAPPDSDLLIDAELKKGTLKSETPAGSKKREALKTPVVALAILGTVYNTFVPNPTTTNVKVDQGLVSAGGQSFGPGQTFAATPTGVSNAPFPAGGNIVITPDMQAAAKEGAAAGNGDSGGGGGGGDSGGGGGGGGGDSGGGGGSSGGGDSGGGGGGGSSGGGDSGGGGGSSGGSSGGGSSGPAGGGGGAASSAGMVTLVTTTTVVASGNTSTASASTAAVEQAAAQNAVLAIISCNP